MIINIIALCDVWSMTLKNMVLHLYFLSCKHNTTRIITLSTLPLSFNRVTMKLSVHWGSHMFPGVHFHPSSSGSPHYTTVLEKAAIPEIYPVCQAKNLLYISNTDSSQTDLCFSHTDCKIFLVTRRWINKWKSYCMINYKNKETKSW